MAHTLVTGPNSFFGATVVKSLIDAGHKVTGSVRRAAAGDDLLAEHPEWRGKLDFVVVPDYGVEGAFDAVFRDVDPQYVVHVAAPMFGDARATEFERDYLKPNIDNNLSLLKSAKQHGKSLKHIAVTGSINAVSTGMDLATRPLLNTSWLPLSPAEAIASGSPYMWYCSAKKEGELALWDFVETQSPSFGVTVFLPALLFGPPIQAVTKPVDEGINWSTDVFYSLFSGKEEKIPPTMFPSYIDIRDLADAHVKSLTAPGARNKRFLVGGMRLTNTAMVATMRELVENGELPKEVLKGLAKESGEDQNVPVGSLEIGPATEAMGLTFRSMEETVRDTVRRILELKARESV